MNNYLITPDSDIYLLKCPLEIDSLNQIDFANATAQHNYFNGLTKILMDDATYVRKDGRLYFEGTFDTLIKYNYCMYRNTNYGNKWFYAFVTDMRFENNNVVSCNLTTDVFQTWMFDITLKPSFIERSHVAKSSDTLGAYTYPENLETGDYKVYFQDKDSTTIPDCVIMGCTIDLATLTQSIPSSYCGMYNGLIAGCGYYRFDNFSQLVSALNGITSRGQQDSIVTMFMYPSSMAPLMSGSNNKVDTGETPMSKDYGISRISSLDGYTPKNKKLLCYPYCYIRLSNGIGTSGIYRQEVWSLNNNNEMVVHADSVLCPGGSIRIYPVNYNGTQYNYDEGFTLGKYPQISWSVDLYTNWEVQNGINLFGTPLTATDSGVFGGLTKATFNASSGNLDETMTNLGQVFTAMNEQYRHAVVPPTIGGNLNSGDVSAIVGSSAFQFQRCGIKQEYARKIDNYFEMFGYKINNVQTPNITNRSNWNFIKTIDVNIEGDIPQEDMQKIKSLFNNGFTVWHTTTHYLDYSQNNT